MILLRAARYGGQVRLCQAFRLRRAYGGQDGGQDGGQGGENAFIRRTGLFRGTRFLGGDFSVESKPGVCYLEGWS